MAIKLPRLPANQKIVDDQGYPTLVYSLWWQQVAETLEEALNAITTALDAAGIAIDAAEAAQMAADSANAAAVAAQTAADNAQMGADNSAAETSIAASGVTNFTPPLLSADTAGNVTIANHDRLYGDGTSVSVTGGVVATGEPPTTAVWIFYDQPSRAGGAVTYQYSTDSNDSLQTGDRHSIGAVTIPNVGTTPGNPVRPRGYAEP